MHAVGAAAAALDDPGAVRAAAIVGGGRAVTVCGLRVGVGWLFTVVLTLWVGGLVCRWGVDGYLLG